MQREEERRKRRERKEKKEKKGKRKKEEEGKKKREERVLKIKKQEPPRDRRIRLEKTVSGSSFFIFLFFDFPLFENLKQKNIELLLVE